MRLTFVALAFLFFTNVLATPINPSHGNAVELRRRSPNKHDMATGKKAAAKCKRATPSELIYLLSKVDEEHPLLEKANCGVYHLTDNKDVILKVIEIGGKRRTQAGTESEAWALHNVQQLLGWGQGQTRDKTFYYLFMKNMGVPLIATEFKNDRKRLRKLQSDAEAFYLTQYHLTHRDHEDLIENPNNWAFREVDGVWRAELIDWELFAKESGYEGYTDPPKPFEIDTDCFLPWKMNQHYYR